MQKFLIGAAALGLMSSSMAVQAQTSSVTVYGVADAGLVLERGGPDGQVSKVSSGVASGSRLGFKGKEDLGGGTTLAFGLENGANFDNGTAGQGGVLFGRQAYLCLTGSAGALSIGRQYTPFYKTLNNIADPFVTGLAGNAQNMFANNSRFDNSVEYITPKLGGFSADGMVSMGEVAGDSGKSRSVSASANYENGPLTASLAHQQRNDASDTAHSRNTILALRYQFGEVAGHLARSRNRDLLGNQSAETLVGFTLAMGRNKLVASYIDHHDSSAAGADARQAAIGYFYSLTRRTDLYTAYGHIINRNGASFRVGTAVDTGSGTTGINLGMRHVF